MLNLLEFLFTFNAFQYFDGSNLMLLMCMILIMPIKSSNPVEKHLADLQKYITRMEISSLKL